MPASLMRDGERVELGTLRPGDIIVEVGIVFGERTADAVTDARLAGLIAGVK
jgi:CRP-like cAMP-binding protein